MRKMNKTNYQCTIGYKSVIVVSVKAEDEDQAKKLALEEFEKYRHFGNKCQIHDDSFNVYGVLDLDKTWNCL